MNQESGFKVPEHYFDELTARILGSNLMKKEVHEGYIVPEGYFEENVKKLVQISHRGGGRGTFRVIRSEKFVRSIAAVAAAILLTLGVWVTKTNDYKSPGNKLASDRIDTGFEKPVISNVLNGGNNRNDEGDAENYLLNNYSQSDLLAEL